MLKEHGLHAQAQVHHWEGLSHDDLVRASSVYEIDPILTIHLGFTGNHYVSVVRQSGRCATLHPWRSGSALLGVRVMRVQGCRRLPLRHELWRLHVWRGPALLADSFGAIATAVPSTAATTASSFPTTVSSARTANIRD